MMCDHVELLKIAGCFALILMAEFGVFWTLNTWLKTTAAAPRKKV